jgi:ADP-ribose pyrophosphatase YjhB (NUDIX family)
MEKDWHFVTDEYICGLRTVGVLVKDGKILVQRDRDGKDFALPGGHIQIGETLEDGLIREFKEETGADIECKRLLWTEECFWRWNNKEAHNVAFYYLIDLKVASKIIDDHEFVSQKDNCNVVLGWIGIEEIQNTTIYPDFLKKEIFNLKEPIKHFISKE